MQIGDIRVAQLQSRDAIPGLALCGPAHARRRRRSASMLIANAFHVSQEEMLPFFAAFLSPPGCLLTQLGTPNEGAVVIASVHVGVDIVRKAPLFNLRQD